MGRRTRTQLLLGDSATAWELGCIDGRAGREPEPGQVARNVRSAYRAGHRRGTGR